MLTLFVLYMIIRKYTCLLYLYSFSVRNTSRIDLSKCKVSQLGTEYKGFIMTTVGGFRCQLWTAERSLHNVSLLHKFVFCDK